MNVGIVNRDDALLALSVTLSWHHEYVALERVVNVMLLSHDTAAVVALLQDPLYVIVPASLPVKL